MADAVSVFILPPSRDVLRERLSHRGTDDAATIARRMRDAISEMAHFDEYEHVIINDDFDTALTQLIAVILAERCRLTRVQERRGPLLQTLLSHIEGVE